MRYPKDTIQLSQSRDLPLLRQVLHSEFVTRAQLFEFMRLSHHEQSRKSFDWRVRRLVHSGLLKRQTSPACTGEFIFSVGWGAAVRLQSMGEYCLLGRERKNRTNIEPNILHALGLNDIHLSALRAGLLVRWVSSVEIRSQNELTRFGYAKDYDAILTVRAESEEHSFALEYERRPKAARYYRHLGAAIPGETRVTRVLYLVTNYDLLQFLSAFFNHDHPQVLFGLVSDWHAQLLGMQVSRCPYRTPIHVRETLAAALTGNELSDTPR